VRFLKSLYFHQRTFWLIFILAMLFLFSYWIPQLYVIVWIVTIIITALLILDAFLLYSKIGIKAERIVPDKFSNSDLNPVVIKMESLYTFKVFAEIIDELPEQFQKRDFLRKIEIAPKAHRTIEYEVKPLERGEYFFGNLNIFISTNLKLLKKRQVFDSGQLVKVYPSFIQMKAFDFLAIDKRLRQPGLKKIRRIGHTQEFEQIKEYVLGDDIRSINWKATAKQNALMVNQYQEEKAQPIYSVIDTGRAMKMPFEGLSLLDYAINSTLAFSNVALQKKDKVGMLSFSNIFGKMVVANAKKTNLLSILENLYNINTQFLDSDFGMLYATINKQIRHRSMIMLYSNFEHINAVKRELPFLRAIAKKHVLVVIFFENTEIEKVIDNDAKEVAEIAHQIIAKDFASEKRLMQRLLQQNGIQTVLTKPKDLTLNTINKYLEIKARGIL